MLVWSLMLMGVSTLGIGLLPDYRQIGLWAPALLLALRLMQGFALGGEWGGAVLMSVEHAPIQQRGLYGSIVALGLPVGIVLSNAVFLVVVRARRSRCVPGVGLARAVSGQRGPGRSGALRSRGVGRESRIL